MTTVRCVLGLVSQGLLAMRADLAACHHRLLGHEAARWNSMLQWGGLEPTGEVPPLSLSWWHFTSHKTVLWLLSFGASSCVMQTFLRQTWSQVRCLKSKQESTHQHYCVRQGNLAGLTHQWKADRATCTPSHGKRFQLWGPPRAVCKKEGVGALAVLTCAVVAPWVPGTYRAWCEMVPARAELHQQLEAPHSSLWMLLDYMGMDFHSEIQWGSVVHKEWKIHS